MAESERSIVLLSGGVDSTAALMREARAGIDSYALTVNYGQSHAQELWSAKMVAGHFGVRQEVIDVPMHQFVRSNLIGHGALTLEESRQTPGVSPYYVPNRNMVLLSLAMAWADSEGISRVVFACNADDYRLFPDCRDGFFVSLGGAWGRERLDLNVTISTPFIGKRKHEIISEFPDAPWGLTWSCYQPVKGPAKNPRESTWLACGTCDACELRRDSFDAAGVRDPVRMIGDN